MIIDNERLPEHLEQGARVGPTFSTSLVSVISGSDEANQNWQDELLEVDAAYGIMDKASIYDPEDSYAAIVSFFRARRGRARGFLFRDASDCEAEDEPIYPVPGPGGLWQICKTYDLYVRKITRPVIATLQLKKNGAELADNTYEIVGTSQIRFLGGSTGEGVTATFVFDVPMRFVSDKLMVQLTHIRAGEIPEISLIQVRE